MLGNDKNNVFVNYLFTKLVFVLKLSGLNGLKGYLKPRINKVWRKNKYKFSVRKYRFIKDISLISFWYNIFTEWASSYLQNCVMTETMSSNKTKLQLRFVLKIKDVKCKVRRINLNYVKSVKINSGRAI